jgi:hypothetical protein
MPGQDYQAKTARSGQKGEDSLKGAINNVRTINHIIFVNISYKRIVTSQIVVPGIDPGYIVFPSQK